MEFLTVNRNKLKISLTEEELKEYGISESDEYGLNQTSRKGLWRILDMARDKCGFSVSDGRVLVQYYPKDGGGELFVTRLTRLAESAERTLVSSPSVTVLAVRRSVYRFSTLDDLIRAARALSPWDDGKNALYHGGGEYYLLTEERSVASVSDTAVLSEYAKEMSDISSDYVREHFTLIESANPMQRLAEL